MDTRRLILVLIFTFSSFMLWESWQKYNQPKPPANAATTAPAGSAVPQPSAALQAGSSAGAAPVAATAAPAAATAETFTVQTDVVKASISPLGGDIVELDLLNYTQHDNSEKTFALFDAKHQYMAQSGLIGEGLPTHRTQFRRVDGPTKLADGADELKVRLEAAAPNGANFYLQSPG